MKKRRNIKINNFDARLFKLEQFIEINNKRTGWSSTDSELPKGVSKVFTEMLVYDGTIGRNSIFSELIDLDKEYKVHLTDRMKDYMIPGDLFLMTLGKFKNQWKILYCSSPYKEESA
ncbi:MAG: hypothetical protein KDD34_07265 [Bdellovibrionales bacterium]|nr:hypothetical protein [Bdellovibrionales bacterium]